MSIVYEYSAAARTSIADAKDRLQKDDPRYNGTIEHILSLGIAAANYINDAGSIVLVNPMSQTYVGIKALYQNWSRVLEEAKPAFQEGSRFTCDREFAGLLDRAGDQLGTISMDETIRAVTAIGILVSRYILNRQVAFLNPDSGDHVALSWNPGQDVPLNPGPRHAPEPGSDPGFASLDRLITHYNKPRPPKHLPAYG